MTDEQLLAGVKIDNQIAAGVTAYDERFSQLISAAKAEIVAAGAATLDTYANDRDAQLVIMYADWLWARRVAVLGNKEDPPMPRMVKLALNNRVFGEKAGASE